MLPPIGIPELLILAVIFFLAFIVVVVGVVGVRWLLPRLARRGLKWWQKTQMEVKRELEEEEVLKSSSR